MLNISVMQSMLAEIRNVPANKRLTNNLRFDMTTFRKNTLNVLLLSALFLFAGCSQTMVTGTWKKSDYVAKPFTSILVVGLTGDTSNRILWENIMADKLRQSGVKTAITTAGAFPDSAKVSDKEILDFVKEKGVEGVLVTRLVDAQKEKVYYPPTGGFYNYTGPYGYYSRFGHYYNHAYEMLYTPGYTQTMTTVLLETNLYKADTRELIWSMSSDTFDPRSFNQLANSVSSKVLKVLKKDKLL